MRYKYIHILAAFFLICGMGVQFYVSYRQAKLYVQYSSSGERQSDGRV